MEAHNLWKLGQVFTPEMGRDPGPLWFSVPITWATTLVPRHLKTRKNWGPYPSPIHKSCKGRRLQKQCLCSKNNPSFKPYWERNKIRPKQGHGRKVTLIWKERSMCQLVCWRQLPEKVLPFCPEETIPSPHLSSLMDIQNTLQLAVSKHQQFICKQLCSCLNIPLPAQKSSPPHFP